MPFRNLMEPFVVQDDGDVIVDKGAVEARGGLCGLIAAETKMRANVFRPSVSAARFLGIVC
jgi:hypothetical protein